MRFRASDVKAAFGVAFACLAFLLVLWVVLVPSVRERGGSVENGHRGPHHDGHEDAHHKARSLGAAAEVGDALPAFPNSAE